MDAAMKNATARREVIAKDINDLQSKLDDLRREMVRVEAFISDWQVFASGGVTMGDSIEGEVRRAEIQPQKKTNRNSTKEAVASAVRELLVATGKPLTRAELFPMLIERGLVIEGSDADMVLSTMLWRMRDKANLIRLRKGGYWLKDVPNNDIDYDPERAAALASSVADVVDDLLNRKS